MAASLKPRELTASERIYALAAKHGISHERSALDELGDVITDLSGDAVELDDTEWLLVALGRAGIVTGAENTSLHHEYLKVRFF